MEKCTLIVTEKPDAAQRIARFIQKEYLNHLLYEFY